MRLIVLLLLVITTTTMQAQTADELEAMRNELADLRHLRDKASDLLWAKERYVNYSWWLLQNEERERQRAEPEWRRELEVWIEAQKSARAAMLKLIDALDADAEAPVLLELKAQARFAEDYVRLGDLRLKNARDAFSFAGELERYRAPRTTELLNAFRQLNEKLAQTREEQITATVRFDRLNKESLDLREEIRQHLNEARQASEAAMQEAQP